MAVVLKKHDVLHQFGLLYKKLRSKLASDTPESVLNDQQE